jgi:hypothetical protein
MDINLEAAALEEINIAFNRFNLTHFVAII